MTTMRVPTWCWLALLAVGCSRPDADSGGDPTGLRGPPSPSTATSDLPAPLPEAPVPAELSMVPGGGVLQTGPDEFIAEFAPDDPAYCGDCQCITDGCYCAAAETGGCLCVTIEGGEDCACTCKGLPSLTREVNIGAAGSPVSGPSVEAP
ncbi:MAG: hypothetical protein JXB32_15090 [Deltaproteobacteria bacterium]|nr:hypothetical protein [Deltaproteobacteria bacterium]